MARRTPRYWLFKSEPQTFSFDDLCRAPGGTTGWDGVRNFQVRNWLRDEVGVGDGVLFYHSSAEPTGVAGLAEVVAAAAPDPTQFDPRELHYDPRSSPTEPRWFQVEIAARGALPRFVTLAELKANPALAELGVVQRGNRLSIQPVTAAQWREVCRMGGLTAG